jgi:PEP-CTERM motif-containing protein
MPSRFRLSVVALLVFASLTLPARADSISGSGGLNNLGSFTGTIDYSFTDAANATLAIQLTNTTAAAGGFLTGFAFNNPDDLITGIALSSTNPNFTYLGGTAFQTLVPANPYGQFDLGASTGTSWEGDGDPSRGIAVGDSATFTFTLEGNSLDTLTTQSFLSTLSTPPGDGEGVQAFVARFRGLADGGSDKVVGAATGGGIEVVTTTGNPDPPLATTTPHAPEPGSLTLAGIGLSCLMVRFRRQRTPDLA